VGHAKVAHPSPTKINKIRNLIVRININPIGVIHSLFDDTSTAARQPAIDGDKGKIVIKEELTEGLEGLEEFSHIIAIYHFHLQPVIKLKARPCFDRDVEHGIFASRYPTRPNHIGISILTLEKIEANTLYCSDVDVVNNTPLLDIKPYVKQFDQMKNPKSGWYDKVKWESIQAKSTESILLS
jgi:tRNA-Thr(GGU) m(6)t(6)A37 methyltransferase TsaA